jgi:hypothetical protein
MSLMRLDVSLKIEPWFQDHTFAAQAVLPAVESMVFLATAARKHYPKVQICNMADAFFPRFMTIPADKSHLQCVVELEKNKECVQATLYSRQKTGRFSRLVKHASLCFGGKQQRAPAVLLPPALKKPPFTVAGNAVYETLVPFGKTYCNLNSVELSEPGCIARLNTPDIPIACPALGSPFLLDSAMHGACVWGQRFAGFVPFPVGLRYRRITAPSKAGKEYQAIIIPSVELEKKLVVDMDITDTAGNMVEQIRGLQMLDVSGGTILPPQWIQQ